MKGGTGEQDVSESFPTLSCPSCPFYHTGIVNTSHIPEKPGRPDPPASTRSCSSFRLGKIDNHGRLLIRGCSGSRAGRDLPPGSSPTPRPIGQPKLGRSHNVIAPVGVEVEACLCMARTLLTGGTYGDADTDGDAAADTPVDADADADADAETEAEAEAGMRIPAPPQMRSGMMMR